MKSKTLLILLGVLALAVIIGLFWRKPAAPGINFGKEITLNVGQTATFADGLAVTLTEINDSRCQPDVQCVWQGELGVGFDIVGGQFTKTFQTALGTVTNRSIMKNGYSITLVGATTNSATIIVTTIPSVGSSGISGYVHVGPTCPVERVPADPNCDDKPYANATIYISQGERYLSIYPITDTQGKFRAAVAPGVYFVGVQTSFDKPLPRCEEKQVTVTANQFTNIDISCDSGIR